MIQLSLPLVTKNVLFTDIPYMRTNFYITTSIHIHKQTSSVVCINVTIRPKNILADDPFLPDTQSCHAEFPVQLGAAEKMY